MNTTKLHLKQVNIYGHLWCFHVSGVFVHFVLNRVAKNKFYCNIIIFAWINISFTNHPCSNESVMENQFYGGLPLDTLIFMR